MAVDRIEPDRVELDRRALDWAASMVERVRPDQLDGPTPCGPWTLRELLGHMIAHNIGWTAALHGTPVGAEVWDRVDIDGDPHEAYHRAATEVADAFAGPSLPERIEVYGYGTLGVPTVLGMHIIDFVVHGWDVARSIGSAEMPPEELSEAAYQIMLRFPDKRPSLAFGVHVPVPGHAPVGDRLMGYVGRDPQWTPGG